MTIALIDDLTQLQTEMLRLIESIGRGAVSESVARVAVSMQVVKQHDGVVDANKALVEMLPEQFRMRLSAEEEVIFQVNQPNASHNLPSVMMNFITKWSVERIQVLAFAMPLLASQVSMQQAVAAPQQQMLTTSVLFDNNNVPGSASLTAKDQSVLLLEGFQAIDKSMKDMQITSENK